MGEDESLIAERGGAVIRRCAMLGTCACIVATMAGCGSSNVDGDPRAEYIAKADAICSQQNKGIQGIGSANHVERVLIPGLRDEIRGLRALAPPPSDVRQVSEFLAAMRLMLARAEGNPQWVAKAGRPFLRTELMAESYGFAECGHV